MKKELFWAGKRSKKSYDKDRSEDETSKREQEFSLVSEQLVNAFTRSYIPVMDERIANEIWTTDKLRVYFSAYIIPKMPDPLPQYIMRLNNEGFELVNTSFGVPGILVIRKRIPRLNIPDNEDSDMEEETNGTNVSLPKSY